MRVKARTRAIRYSQSIKGKAKIKAYSQKPEVKTRKRKVILEHQEHILIYKKDKGCSICGYKEYPEILQFHHKDRKQKSFTIGKKFGKNIEVIKREMEKCILLCPNCHAWLHFKEEQEKVT